MMESGAASATVSSSNSSFVGTSSSSSRSRERFSITSTLLNGNSYAIWAQAVKIYYMGEQKYSYLTADPPNKEDKQCSIWEAEDGHICVEL